MSAMHYIKGFLEKLNFKKFESVACYPHKVISSQRLENINSSYEPTPRPDLEKDYK